MATTKRRQGGCLCGAVRFEVSVPEAKYNICHCGACRKWSAGPLMAVHCPADAAFERAETLTWFRSSDWAERGFCGRCGSSLFWRLADDPGAMLIVAADAFDKTDDLELDRHIYVDAQPARYAFADRRPRITEAELMAELGIAPQGDG